MASQFLWRRLVTVNLLTLICTAMPVAAQLSRAQLFEQKPQMQQEKETLQKKQPTTQKERVPLDGVIDREKYILGPGDEMEVSIWGGQEYFTYNLFITAEGRLLLPSIGPVDVGQLSIARAEQLVAEKAGELFTSGNISLSLVNPRLFRAFIVGGVYDPGTYYESAVDRVSDLVRMGGGIKAGATRRSLRLLDRDRNLIATADLLAYAATGDPETNPRLLDGCILEVPTIQSFVILRGRFVNLAGSDSVKITEYYKEEASDYKVEFLPGESLADLFRMTGGPDDFDMSDSSTVQVIDPAGRRSRLFLDAVLDKPLAAGTTFEFPTRQRWVFVTGNVNKGGRYLYQPGWNVGDYLGLAGGANWNGANDICILTRSNGDKSKVRSTAGVEPGDLLFVPGRVQWLDRTIGPVIGLVGVMIAVFHN